MTKIAYEPHPVTPERKAELRAQGFKIVDARFKPADAVEPEQSAPVDPHRRGTKARLQLTARSFNR